MLFGISVRKFDKGRHQGGVLTSILSLLHLAVWRKGRTIGIILCVRVTFMDISRYRNERAADDASLGREDPMDAKDIKKASFEVK